MPPLEGQHRVVDVVDGLEVVVITVLLVVVEEDVVVVFTVVVVIDFTVELWLPFCCG